MTAYIAFGRCRSGKRWFWFAQGYAYDAPAAEHCDDPACGRGVTGHEYGWEDAEETALAAMHAAAARFGDTVLVRDRTGNGRSGHAAAILKKINAARRNARPPRPGAASAAPVEYLYEPYSWYSDSDVHYEGVTALQVVRKTAKRVYYDKTDARDRSDGVVTLGFVGREELEADTRCRNILCPRDVPSDPVCEPHGRNFPHCIHWGIPWEEQDRFHRSYRACAQACPADTPGWHCMPHGFTWDHCPHGDGSGECWHGLPAGAARLPRSSRYDSGGIVFTSREAAEEWLHGKQAEPEDLKALRMAMADAHPDRGGTAEAFMAARQRYERALREAS